MQTYTIYTRCDHCGVYDRDKDWCALCQKPKQAKPREKAIAATPEPRKAHA